MKRNLVFIVLAGLSASSALACAAETSVDEQTATTNDEPQGAPLAQPNEAKVGETKSAIVIAPAPINMTYGHGFAVGGPGAFTSGYSGGQSTSVTSGSVTGGAVIH